MEITGDYNAFDDNIAPGGLRNTAQIKLLICYVADKVTMPLTDKVVTEALTEHGLVNYFEVTQAIFELTEGKNINIDDGVITLTPKGSSSLAELVGEIPKSVRERALADTNALLMRMKNEIEHFVEITGGNNEYYVTCRIMNEDKEQMTIRLLVKSLEQAQKVKKNFLSDPSAAYSEVIAKLYT